MSVNAHEQPRPPLRAIFFDAAGTLFHLREPVGNTYAHIAAKHGVIAEPRILDKAFRSAWKTLPSPLHPEGGPPADDDRSWWRAVVWHTFAQATASILDERMFEPMFTEMYEHFAHADAWQLYGDTVPALERLGGHKNSGNGAHLFVVSNFDSRLHPILKGLGIADFFQNVLLSSEVGASKPHPRIFTAAMTAAGAAPGECLHVGDDAECDLNGARAAGMHAMLVHRPEVTLLTITEKVLQDEFVLAPSRKVNT